MKLIVAEKPSVGRDIASTLGHHRRENGALLEDGWSVTWTLGHLAELAPPDAYGEEYERRRREMLSTVSQRSGIRGDTKTREQFRGRRR